ncbi:MAG: sigma-70 family RNA polymerase sigma factor [Gemmataceae bacterium]|nr:sigma-70 family RNA polymerase sigma factor [Gemmataceae bacterium]
MNAVLPRSRRPGAMMAMFIGAALTVSPSHAEAAPEAIQGLSRYCTSCWRNAGVPVDRWVDCTQEVMVRLLERVPVGGWPEILDDREGDSHREFVRAIDTVKKRVQRERRFRNVDERPVSDSRIENERRLDEQRQLVEHASRQVLTGRQQQILQRTGEGFGIGDIAKELGTTPDRISDEKYKAIRKLRVYLEDMDNENV